MNNVPAVDQDLSDITLTQNSNSVKKLPGDLAMWFFILAELTVFAIFFLGFAVAENLNTEMFSSGKEQLHRLAGLINTVALITSSCFVAFSLHSVRKNREKSTFIHLLFALFFATIYVIVKLWEYQVLFDKGIDIETNTFFTLYFLITAFHFMHILLGMVILVYMAINVLKGKYTEENSTNTEAGFESGACYWHMVDLLWIILFPLIYVI